MATACPDKNCLVLMRHPVFDPVENLRAPEAAATPNESFAVVAAPVVPAEGAPYNRVALVLNVRTDGRAIKAYRAQLENALKTLDAALRAGTPAVELTLKVPEDLTRPQKVTRLQDDKLEAGTDKKKSKEKEKGAKGKTKTSTKKKKG